mgnify:CR=1 FL=1|jgi:hypothetical protein
MILKYKASIPGSKVFLREYEVKSEMSLFKLHTFLQDSLSFAPDQMIVFRAYDAQGKMTHQYGLFDLGGGSFDRVSVGKTVERNELQLRYVYDIKGGKYIRLDYIGEGEYVSRYSYPRITREKGMDPEQFSKTYSDLDELTPDHDDFAPDSSPDVYDGGADAISDSPDSEGGPSNE